jgi:hypothetical protein
LGNESDPVVVGFVFKSDLDLAGDFCCERLKIFLIVNVNIWCHSDGVDDAVDDAPAAGFQSLFRLSCVE